MTQVMILSDSGKAASRAEVSAELAEQAIKSHLIHETVLAELAARRAGTHSTLTRGKVRGGGTKPWRQKGTGRARHGSIRSPLWAGGGITFGPTPRTYGGKVNRKVRRQAFLGALRAHVERLTLAVMDPTGWTEPSTKRAAEYLRAAPERIAERPLLVCLDDADGVDARSFRNLAGVDVLPAVALETADLLAYRAVLIERAAWERMAGELGKSKKVTAKDVAKTAGEATDEQRAAGADEREARAEAQADYATKRQAEREDEEAQAAAAAAAVAALTGAGTEANADDGEDEEAEADADATVLDADDVDEDVEGDDEAAAAGDDGGEEPEAEDAASADVEPETAADAGPPDEDVVISDEELEAEALAARDTEDVVISDEELEAEALAAGDADEIDETNETGEEPESPGDEDEEGSS